MSENTAIMRDECMQNKPQTNSYDVIVVGLGGMGSAAAYHLARRGQRVLGLERFTPAHDRGSSHGGSRIIRLAYFEDPAYVPLLFRAYELWRELECAAGCELLFETGGLLLGPPASLAVAGARRSADEWGLSYEVLDAAGIRRRFPTLAPGDETIAFFESAAGILRPEATVSAHLRLAQIASAELHFEEPVIGWDAGVSGEGVTVRTGEGIYRAGRLVVCPGAWAPALTKDMEMPLIVERQVQTWFQPEGGVSAFLPDRHPVWLWEPEGAEDAASFHGFVYGMPAIDGPAGGVKMGIIVGGTACTPETIDRTASEAELETVAEHLRGRLAVGIGRLLRSDICMFENSPDNHFVVGPHPAHPQVTLAAGFSGHGFKFVPVIGEILADLVCDGETSHPIALFDPDRLRAALPA
ncbi:MAG: N-methyl-L-tryptophan oxidase [Acidimicrobiia bacterium]